MNILENNIKNFIDKSLQMIDEVKKVEKFIDKSFQLIEQAKKRRKGEKSKTDIEKALFFIDKAIKTIRDGNFSNTNLINLFVLDLQKNRSIQVKALLQDLLEKHKKKFI